MKKYLFLLIAALLIVPGIVAAQGTTLSNADITRIANSVVLIVRLDANGQPQANGSGTIMTPGGEIFTNRHVVEGGSDFAVLTLSNMGEPAQLAYFAKVILVHPTVDFAVLQIDRDANGHPINAQALNLPFMTPETATPSIGDHLTVFGYPDLGDAHLVVTSGSITTIENDTLDGQRIPYWYQTDAQISPGNSGGLVVDSSGNMIGIPTQVRSEDRTLGRLGAILTITAITAAIHDQPNAQITIPNQTQQQPPSQATLPPIFNLPQLTPEVNPTVPAISPTLPAIIPTLPAIGVTPTITKGGNNNNNTQQPLTIAITNVEHNVTNNNEIGMKIHVTATANGYNGVPLRAAIFLFWGDGTEMLANNVAPADEHAQDGQLTVQQVVTPGFDNTVWDDLWFFVSYANLPEGRTGTFPAYIEAQLGPDGQPLTAVSDPVSFNYTYPTQQLIVDITSIEHNVQLNNLIGMRVHTHIRTIGYQGQTLRVALFVYWKDGTAIPGTGAPSANQSPSGNLTVQDTINPTYDDTQWADFWFFLPYSYFPTGLHGDQDAFAEVEIGLDGEQFARWSNDTDFVLNYPAK